MVQKSNSDDLSTTEHVAMGFAHRALFQKLEGQYYLFKHGQLEPILWKQRRNWARSVVNLPLGQNWWGMEIKQSIYSPEFIDVISNGKIFEVKLPGV